MFSVPTRAEEERRTSPRQGPADTRQGPADPRQGPANPRPGPAITACAATGIIDAGRASIN